MGAKEMLVSTNTEFKGTTDYRSKVSPYSWLSSQEQRALRLQTRRQMYYKDHGVLTGVLESQALTKASQAICSSPTERMSCRKILRYIVCPFCV